MRSARNVKSFARSRELGDKRKLKLMMSLMLINGTSAHVSIQHSALSIASANSRAMSGGVDLRAAALLARRARGDRTLAAAYDQREGQVRFGTLHDRRLHDARRVAGASDAPIHLN